MLKVGGTPTLKAQDSSASMQDFYMKLDTKINEVFKRFEKFKDETFVKQINKVIELCDEKVNLCSL